MAKITLITGNEGKVAQYRHVLGDAIDHQKLDLDEIQAVELEDVMKHKLQQAYDSLQKPIMVDDGGLFVKAWNGFPGALTKWMIEGPGLDGILKMLEGFDDRSAEFRVIIGYCDANGSQLFNGITQGSIATEPRGDNGFGVEPIFIPAGQDKTNAEMTMEEKMPYSHRAKAIAELKKAVDAGKITL